MSDGPGPMSPAVAELLSQPGVVPPDYAARSLVQVPRAIAAALNPSAKPSGLPAAAVDLLTGCDHILLLVLDGCGWNLVEPNVSRPGLFQRLQASGFLEPITTTFPSSTAPALTTLATADPPGVHGLYEWWVMDEHWAQTIQPLAYTLADSRERDALSRYGGYPGQLYDGETFYEKLSAGGAASYSFLPNPYHQQTYARSTHRGSGARSFTYGPELVASVRRHVEATTGPAYSYLYWPEIDSIEHRFGPDSDEAALAVASFNGMFLEGLRALDPAAARRTALMVVADHGHVAVDPEAVIRLNDVPEIMTNLHPSVSGKPFVPAGGPRTTFLDLAVEDLEPLLVQLRGRFDGKAEVLTVDEATTAGLFGEEPITDRFRRRAGNVLIVARDRVGLWYQYSDRRPWDYKGIHGGLSAAEMQIPLGVARLSDLI